MRGGLSSTESPQKSQTPPSAFDKAKSSRTKRHAPGTAYGRAVLASAIDRIADAPDGLRHRTTFSAAAAVGQVVGGGELYDDLEAQVALVRMARAVGLDDADRQVRRGLERGRCKPRRAPAGGRMLQDATDARDKVLAWWEAVESRSWTGRGTVTTLRLLAAFGLLAMKAGKMRLSESQRQVAEAAGVDHRTVGRHRHRLSPFVRVVEHGSRVSGKVTTWQLVVVEDVASCPNPEGSPPGKAGLGHSATPLQDPAHDTWHRWPSGWRLWSILDEAETNTVADLAAASGIHRSTCYRSLPRLKALGLAVTDGDSGWRAVVPRGVDDGGITRRRRRQRHKDDRERWERWRAERMRRREVAS